ncbi:MAG: aminoglycoside phosphotransferase family protein [Planctomycetes bacterium]|nr:aminoglycoside phosphotransferase family protein [Planctomycetota bacterium]
MCEYDPRDDAFTERDPRTDPALPALRSALDAGELVAYRPGRRATVRFGGGASFAKLLRPKRAAELVARHAALEALRPAAGPGFPRIPALTTTVPPRGILVFAAARGTSLDALLRAEVVDPRAIGSVARGLAAFHGAPVDANRFPAAPAARSLPEWIELVRPHDAALAIDATELARELGEAPPCARPTLIHGDCHDRNVFVACDELTLIDLDLCGLGDPCADAGNLAAHLLLRAVQDGERTARGWEDAARFLCAYAQASRSPAPETLVLSTARTLVRLACVHRFRRGWSTSCPQLLAAARETAQRLAAANSEP